MPLQKCDAGEIHRRPYDATRSATGTSYHVKSVCIKDEGKPGKTPKSKRIPVDMSKEDEDLGVYGYKDVVDKKAESRHSILRKAISMIAEEKKIEKHDAAVKVMRRLNVLYILNRNTHKTLALLLERDRNWVGRNYLGEDYARK
jgi:hypothetical protein